MGIKLWGQEIEQIDAISDTWKTHIRRGVWREGQPVKVGINQKIVNFLSKRSGSSLIISCDDPQVEFTVSNFALKAGEEFHDKTSPSGNMPMRLITIPKSAYQSR